MSTRTRRNGYRGEPSREGYIALLPKQRLCLKETEEGKRCIQPRRHRGKCKA